MGCTASARRATRTSRSCGGSWSATPDGPRGARGAARDGGAPLGGLRDADGQRAQHDRLAGCIELRDRDRQDTVRSGADRDLRVVGVAYVDADAHLVAEHVAL